MIITIYILRNSVTILIYLPVVARSASNLLSLAVSSLLVMPPKMRSSLLVTLTAALPFRTQGIPS